MQTIRTVGPGLAPARSTLDNGVVVLVRPTAKTPAVAINLAVRAGSIWDPPDEPGATYLLSRVIDRGTLGLSADAIAEEIDGRGVSLAIHVTRHLFSVVCTCLAKDFEVILALLGDVLMAPVVPEGELATRKGEVVTAIRQDADNPAVRASEALMALLYAEGHPYGRPTKGSIEVIEGLARDRLLALHAARFRPGGLSAVIVGDVDAGRALETADRVFGEWRGGPPAPMELPQVPRSSARTRRVVPMMNKAQADIAYGFTTIARTDPSYYACWLMNVALGQYALGGRLGDNIRERQGMAYSVSSSFDANVAAGPLVIRAGVSPANVERTIAAIDEELVRLRRDGLLVKELGDVKQYLIGSMPRALETNAGIANFLQTMEFFGLGMDYDLRLPGMLNAVTPDEVRAAAQANVEPARATIVVAGPYTENQQI